MLGGKAGENVPKLNLCSRFFPPTPQPGAEGAFTFGASHSIIPTCSPRYCHLRLVFSSLFPFFPLFSFRCHFFDASATLCSFHSHNFFLFPCNCDSNVLSQKNNGKKTGFMKAEA